MFKIFSKKSKKQKVEISSKFKIGDYVDFHYKDDIYFGHVSNIYLDDKGLVSYDIDIAGQCPATIEQIEETKIIRIHK